MAVEFVAKAKLPTKFGKFQVHAFRDDNGLEHLALVGCEHTLSELHGKMPIPVRIHSKCLTGDTFASKRCDCRAQLETALKYLGKKKCGVLIYLDQEGRGIGLANKIKAYSLQDNGMDTVEANLKLGFEDDMRDFSVAAEILRYFGINKIALLTNNPGKISDLERHGIGIVKRIPLITGETQYNKHYLETKRKKMNHLV